ncbi:MAG TPA: ABC transporter permease [Sneathiellales bacterium]|nr:ABC transporter permease [Sneathiellales bacterium]
MRWTVFVLFTAFLYGPLIVVMVLSFQGPDGGLTFPMQGTSIAWFREVFNPTFVGDFRAPFGRSLILAIVVMIITSFVAFLAGLAYRRGFAGSGAVFYLTVASLIVPSFLVSMGIGLGFTGLNMLASWWSAGLGAHLTWTLPFGVLIMLAIFARLDRSIEEAARDQGATPWQNLRHVVIPIVAPGLIAVALFGFTLSYDEYARTSLLTGQGNTMPVEMVAVTGTAARPSLYAIGTLTTVFSLAIIFLTFGILYAISRRRAGGLMGGGAVPEGEIYGTKLTGSAGTDQ